MTPETKARIASAIGTSIAWFFFTAWAVWIAMFFGACRWLPWCA